MLQLLQFRFANVCSRRTHTPVKAVLTCAVFTCWGWIQFWRVRFYWKVELEGPSVWISLNMKLFLYYLWTSSVWEINSIKKYLNNLSHENGDICCLVGVISQCSSSSVVKFVDQNIKNFSVLKLAEWDKDEEVNETKNVIVYIFVKDVVDVFDLTGIFLKG